MPTFHLVSSTIRLNGGISAGSLGRSLLNISANSVQSVRNRDCRSSSPERCMRERMSVSESGVDQILTLPESGQFYHDLFRHHHREMLSRVVQTQELMTLVCVMFGLLSAPLMGMLKVDRLGCF